MNRNEKQRKVLGKGLSALLPPRPPAPVVPQEPSAQPSSDSSNHRLRSVAIHLIDPNPVQPRTVFDDQRIQELADSIKVNGVIQPIIVRSKRDRFEVVAGERRLRAAKLSGLDEVPAVIQDFADDRILELALVENIQREDLNPIEMAHAFDRLARDLQLSHEEIGRRTGKDRATVTNVLRLLKLPDEIQILLAEHRLSMGHARALLSLPTEEQQIELANRAAAQGFSVREVERLVQQATQQPSNGSSSGESTSPADPNVKAAARELEDALGTRVRIVERTHDRGRIEIEYYSQDDLDRLYRIVLDGAQLGRQ